VLEYEAKWEQAIFLPHFALSFPSASLALVLSVLLWFSSFISKQDEAILTFFCYTEKKILLQFRFVLLRSENSAHPKPKPGKPSRLKYGCPNKFFSNKSAK